ncbi:sigma-70 family RNA polymerase sigma factor [Bradyrhizobium erythrophlei]|jgi:RNA polymerase sigma factor (sigma-70 family)|uniref:RNA polymerase sigma-70 factor, ECF subfamily n=1 Tax=Bradyrhizobium erythrophlei TaxID=1437360 RepID=A0A1M5GNM3_9BRAD|nr:sigma-70 family RNA polymerase sigma factor [Bradyrhizobium erythrophlei]SHG05296.1 RNA polymerase sigma-70 factor, ECF subfamily [Bradyrhizobium erythrophlei]
MADIAHLIEPVIPALRRYARTFVRGAADADDLVQDTLERAISRWYQRRSDGETRAWLFTILHNLAVNHLRRAARRGREVPLDDAGESDVAVPSAQEDALRRDDILGAVGRLPDEQRSVLLLVSIEDVSYAEAARILGIPIGTVMSRLARARAQLQKLLEQQGKPASDRPYLRRVQ